MKQVGHFARTKYYNIGEFDRTKYCNISELDRTKYYDIGEFDRSGSVAIIYPSFLEPYDNYPNTSLSCPWWCGVTCLSSQTTVRVIMVRKVKSW